LQHGDLCVGIGDKDQTTIKQTSEGESDMTDLLTIIWEAVLIAIVAGAVGVGVVWFVSSIRDRR